MGIMRLEPHLAWTQHAPGVGATQPQGRVPGALSLRDLIVCALGHQALLDGHPDGPRHGGLQIITQATAPLRCDHGTY